jgi:LCP family protein required for cell wall assembly
MLDLAADGQSSLTAVRAPGLRAHRSWRERLVLCLGVLGVLGAVLSAAALSQFQRTFSEIPRIVGVDAVLATEDLPDGAAVQLEELSGAQNYLLVGTDSAEGLDPDDPVLVGRDSLVRTDTMMILRIDPDDNSAALMSIPRDLWVPIAGTTSTNRINAALERGGANGRVTLISTIEEFFEIDVHHYVEVNFLGFRELVDTLGGVDVYFEYPARDRKSGFEVLEGQQCVSLDSTEALAYARSRSYQSFIDGRWVTDGTGDIGRISRQQHFIRQSLRQAVSITGRNLFRVLELATVGVNSVTLGGNATEVRDLVSLAGHFRNYDPDDLPTYTLPTTPRTIRGAEVLELREDYAQPILDVFRGIEEGEVSPRSTRVIVHNGTGAARGATIVADELGAAGFDISSTGDANSFDYETSIVAHGPADLDEALLLASYIDGEVELFQAAAIANADIILTTGSSFNGVRDEPVDRPELVTTTTSTTVRADRTTTTAQSAPDPTLPEVTDAAERAARFGVVTELPDGVSC